VLSKFVSGKGLKLTIKVEITPENGVTEQQIEETCLALRELGLDDKLENE
jgi:hypothetical protein